MQKRKLKIRKPLKIVLSIIAIIIAIMLILLLTYKILENKYKKIGYSEKAFQFILTTMKLEYANDHPKNKTLNKAFESNDYKEKNLEHYSNITYRNQEHLIKNINTLIKKKYSDREISMIITHGDDKSVTDFTKRDRIPYLEEFFSYDFAKLEYYDRYINYMNQEGDDEETTILKVNMDIDKEDYKDPVLVNDYSKLVIANKHHYLGDKYVPKNLIKVPEEYVQGKEEIKGTNEAVASAIKMIKAAKKDGLNLLISSGYRSYKEQEETYQLYSNLYGEDYSFKYVMKPGFSEHQTGYSFDFASGNSKIFKESEEFNWMVKNCYDYGFIYRYLKKTEDITGIKNEPWHYRYVGVEAAKKMDVEELTFEEYYAKYVAK